MRIQRLAALLLATAFLTPLAPAQSDDHWLATWTAANMQLTIPAKLPIGQQDLTIRQIVHISQGGKHLRITFTNEFGTTPLQLAAVHVAFLSAGSKILPATDHALTFGGQPGITIAPGAFASTDAITTTVPIYSDLVISAYLPQQSIPVVTGHSLARATTWFAPGNLTTAEQFTDPAATPPGLAPPDLTPVAKAPLNGDKPEKPIVAAAPTPQASATSNVVQTTSWYFLKNVEVDSTKKSAAVVTFGDSITDGYSSTPETNRRYPDDLAALLGANGKTAAFSVLNAGISGNGILRTITGPSALDRFNRDALSQPGARFIILLEGINDLGHAAREPEHPAPVPDMIAAMRTLIEQAHARGIKIYGATLTPCGGSDYYTPTVEDARQQLNQFILAGGAFDGVIDFDKAIRDPNNEARMLPKFDSGDHLHPSDAGYAAMAASIKPKLFTKKK